jgi:uncharacterized membrane protein
MQLLAPLLTWIHVLLVVVWLGTDFVVFALSWSLKNRDLPVEVRLDRARLAHRFDTWVIRAFLLTPLVGVGIAWAKWGSLLPLFTTPWLALKLALMGVVFLLAVLLIAGSAGTAELLEEIRDASGNVDDLEAQLRRRVNRLAYPALGLHVLLAAMILIALVGSRGFWFH